MSSELNTLLARMYGVVRRPRPTFAAILRAPSWAPVLMATTAITFLCSLGFLRTDVGRQALVDQWERTATAFGQTVDDAAYARMEERAESGGLGVLYAAATALGYGPVLVFGVSALLFFVLTPRHSYARVLAVVAARTGAQDGALRMAAKVGRGHRTTPYIRAKSVFNSDS